MGEEAEDVKPKIDLTINYEGQSQHFHSCGCGMGHSCGSGERSFLSRSVHGQGEAHNAVKEGF